LQFAPATYYAQKTRPESARRRTDEVLRLEIQRVYDASLDGVYGAKKVWKELKREGRLVARCTVERLMKDMGLSGVQKGRRWKGPVF
jgi:putative transposase